MEILKLLLKYVACGLLIAVFVKLLNFIFDDL